MLVLETVVGWWFGSEPVLASAGRLGWKARAGRYDSTRRAPRQSGPGRSDDTREDARGVPSNPTNSTPGRSLVTRRAVVDIVRAATLGSYGVVGFAGGGPRGWLAEYLGIEPRGVRVTLAGEIGVELHLVVGHGLPIAEVARQVDSAVRYAVGRALDREVGRLTIHVDGLRVVPFEIHDERASGHGGSAGAPSRVRPDDLAGSGTDVA